MMRTTQALVLFATGVLLQHSWLRLPLPALDSVESIPPDRQPRLGDPWPVNTLLRDAGQRLFDGAFLGAESVALAPNGTLWVLDRYGYAHTAEPPPPRGSGPAPPLRRAVHYVGPGRPLGFHFDAAGHLVICDSLKGLTALDPDTGALRILANRASPDSALHPGSEIRFANDLDVARDGSVYFSDSGSIPPALNRGGFYDTLASYVLTVLHGGARGRLMVLRPGGGGTHVLVPGLWFANGVALAADESFVLVVETCSMRVHKHWLRGPRAGSTEVLLDALPGFPDGLARASDGNFWLAIIAPARPLWALSRLSRPARWALAWLLQVVPVPVSRLGLVAKVSPEGEVLQVLMDPGGRHVSGVSGVAERGGRLYMGHLTGSHVSMLELSGLPEGGAA